MDNKITFDFSVKSVFTVVFGLILLWVLFYLRDVIVLFFLAFILATAIEPLVNYLGRKKVPRIVTILGVYALLVLFFYMLFRLVVPPITEQVNHFVNDRHVITERISAYLDKAPASIRSTVYDFSNHIPEKISKYTSSNVVVNNVLGVFSGLFGFVTVLVITLYLLIENNSMENFIRDYWPSKSQTKAAKMFKEIVTKISYWARGQLVLSGSIGILTYVGLSVLGVDYALTLAIIAAVTELLPVVGPFIGAVPAILIAIAVSPNLALWVAVLYLGIQQFENHVLVPQVMKKAVGLSPVATIFALLVGAKMLGIIGVIISVPVASAVGVLINSVKRDKNSR
jgi:predicted PurR-regulated permease PerM